MRFGVFGGTFDPPHVGHLRAAEAARETLGLERVVFVPAGRPPHKTGDEITEARQRVEMLRSAIAGNDSFEISALELEREGPSFTVDTLGSLTELYPNRDWFFIIGSDAFADLPTWKDWKRLIGEYRLLLLARPGYSAEDARDVIPQEFSHCVFSPPFDADDPRPSGVYLAEAPLLRVSASELRSRVREGHGVRYLVPEAVHQYIIQNRLYHDDGPRS